MICTKDLNKHLRNFQDDPSNELFEDEFVKIITLIATEVIKHGPWMHLDHDDLLQECLIVGLEKSHRFNWEYAERSGYFDSCSLRYFSACMMCKLRELYRSQKNYIELKEKRKK
jgi:hypothetical protein